MVEIKEGVSVPAWEIAEVSVSQGTGFCEGKHYVSCVAFTGLIYNIPCRSPGEAKELAESIIAKIDNEMALQPAAAMIKELRQISRKVDQLLAQKRWC